jgi:hypothetical protein
MRIFVTGVVYVFMTAGCSGKSDLPEEHVYTLYRNSPYLQATEGANLDPKWNRVHIATFDADGKDDEYNRSICDKTAIFFNNEWQETSNVRPEYFSNFWCEEGRFKAVE